MTTREIPAEHIGLIRAVAGAMRECGITVYQCGDFRLELGAAPPEPHAERPPEQKRDPAEDKFAASGLVPINIRDLRDPK